MIKRSAHRSVRDLVASIRTWITNWNDNPKPFVWHKSADEILASLVPRGTSCFWCPPGRRANRWGPGHSHQPESSQQALGITSVTRVEARCRTRTCLPTPQIPSASVYWPFGTLTLNVPFGAETALATTDPFACRTTIGSPETGMVAAPALLPLPLRGSRPGGRTTRPRIEPWPERAGLHDAAAAACITTMRAPAAARAPIETIRVLNAVWTLNCHSRSDA